MITVAVSHSQDYLGRTFNADVTPKQSIRIYGDGGPSGLNDERRPFDKTFKIGDWAVYDSYNFSYTGKITAIGEKTVTIQPYPDSKQKHAQRRLSLYEFSWRNWNYDAAKIAKERADWYD